MLLAKDVEEVVVDVLGHCPWFTPVLSDLVQAQEWATTMAVLMPLQREACEKERTIPSCARLSGNFVLPRVEAGMTSEEIVAEWTRLLSGKPPIRRILRSFFRKILRRFVSFRIRNFFSRLIHPSIWEDKFWSEKERK